MEKTMIDIAEKALLKHKTMTFKQLWNIINKELKPEWKKTATLPVPKLEEQKRGEFYKLLTIDGRFLRLRDRSFGLVERFTYEERQQMKIAVQEET